MAARKSLSKKLRFEVFKRDSFTCQYCGSAAPDVVLVVDHIQPVSKGGDSDITNLITSCEACNSGKSDRTLDDASVAKKRKAQLDALQARREQLTMMVDWQRGLVNLEEEQAEQAASFFNDLVQPHSLNDNGRETLKKHIKKFGLAEVLESTRISASQYLKRDEDGEIDLYDVVKVFDYIPRIASTRRRNANKPYLKDLYYIRGILRNRMSYCNDWMAISLLENAYTNGHEIDDLRAWAIEARSWSAWRITMEEWAKDGEE